MVLTVLLVLVFCTIILYHNEIRIVSLEVREDGNT